MSILIKVFTLFLIQSQIILSKKQLPPHFRHLSDRVRLARFFRYRAFTTPTRSVSSRGGGVTLPSPPSGGTRAG
jgi:hypothetical protein